MTKRKKYMLCLLAVCAVAAILFFVFNTVLPPVRVEQDGLYVSAAKTKEVQKLFKAIGYDMVNHIKEKKPIPPVFVKTFPSDFNDEKYDSVRPALFTEIMMPVILKVNDAILKERAEISAIREEFLKNGFLSERSEQRLAEFLKRYDVKPVDEKEALFAALLPRVDQVSPSIMLAMAAEDSGWATSKYARKYNAPYNQRNWNGQGAVPDEKQKEGPQYKIETYDSLYDAVAARAMYMNTNGYMDNYRMARTRYRRTKNDMRGYSVAHLLVNFPDRPIKYPDIIKHLVLQYEWTPLDAATLDDKTPQLKK